MRRRFGWETAPTLLNDVIGDLLPSAFAVRGEPEEPALILAAAASIAEAGLDQADKAIAIAVFVALGSITVAGAVLFYLVDAERAAPALDAIRRFMSANNPVIMMVVLLLIGAKLLGDGLAVL
jgi:hypothetical protein